MNHRIRRAARLVYRSMLKPLSFVNSQLYTRMMSEHLKRNGMNIEGSPFYFSTSIYFDGTDYSLITLGNGISISKNVTFLTHDFSANTVFEGLELSNIKRIVNENNKNGLLSKKAITIGQHTFIGMNSLILPGTNIGDNCIIGAGSVVRGQISNNSIVMGNPAKVVKKTSEWLERKYWLSDE